MFWTRALLHKLADDSLHLSAAVPSLSTLSDSQRGGPGHGNSPDETTKFNLEVQSQRKKKLSFGKCFLRSEAGDSLQENTLTD